MNASQNEPSPPLSIDFLDMEPSTLVIPLKLTHERFVAWFLLAQASDAIARLDEPLDGVWTKLREDIAAAQARLAKGPFRQIP